jgi:hypothetical protein
MSRIVVRVTVDQIVIADSRPLVEKAATPATGHRVDSRHSERAIRSGPNGIGVGGTAKKARCVECGE